MNPMSEKLTITKDELVSLLKAAYKAYQSQVQPSGKPGEDWIEWCANYVVEKVGQAAKPAPPSQPTQTSQPTQASQALHSTHVLSQAQPKPAQTTDPLPRLSTAKLPERPEASPKVTTDKLDDKGQAKGEVEQSMLQVCPTCAHRNRPGVFFCENCGTNLMTGQQAALGTRDLREAQENEPSGDAASKDKKPEPVLKLDKEQEKAVRTAGSSVFTPGMLLRIEVEGGSTPIIVKPKAEDMILGRRDPTTGATPEVDLTAYAGYRMGVSRRHSSLALENNQLTLWDLGSSNGTFINGNRLTPHQPSPLRDGDEVRLGQMVLRLFFQNAPNNIT
jgi:hypothetical protein